MVGLKNSHIYKNLSPKLVNLRDVAGSAEEEEEETNDLVAAMSSDCWVSAWSDWPSIGILLIGPVSVYFDWMR